MSFDQKVRELQALPVGNADFLDEAFIKRRRIVHTRERLSQLADGALNVRHPQPLRVYLN